MGVFWQTQLWNVMFGQHRLHKLGQVQGRFVILQPTNRHFLVFGEVHHMGLHFGPVKRSICARNLLI
jgi:hypothetical protein